MRQSFLALDAKTQVFHRCGFPERSQSDIAQAAAGLPRNLWLFGRYTILGEDIHLPELIRSALIAATSIPELRENYHRIEKKKGTLTSMVEMALIEHRTGSICRKCNGKGELTEPELIRCSKCGGKGTFAVSDTEKARHLGKDKRAYSRYWRETYEMVYRMLDGWGNDLDRHMKSRLRY